MVDDASSDDAALSGLEPDAHGHAALLLVESLIHGLIARSVISVAEAVEIVEIAAESDADIAEENRHSPKTAAKSLHLLQAIGASLRHDLTSD